MIQSDMYELRNRVLSIPALCGRLDTMWAEIQTAKDEVSALLWQYERESRDVARIKEEKLSAFLYKLVGKYEGKLEKEQNEELNAKIAYDRAVSKLNGLTRDKDDLTARIARLREDEKTYEAELESRRREIITKMSDAKCVLYGKLNDERNTVVSQITEIDEALRALSQVCSTAESIAESLDSARGWATFDAFTRGGIISHMAKYSHIDEAEEQFGVLSYELQALKSELDDVIGLSTSGLSEISSFERTVDFWFDNIFTDLSVRGQIKDNEAQIEDLLMDLSAVESTLTDKRRDFEDTLEQNRLREEELLLTLSS